MSNGTLIQTDARYHVDNQTTQDTTGGLPLGQVVTQNTVTGVGPGVNVGGAKLNDVAAGYGGPAWTVNQFNVTNMTIATRGIKQIHGMVMQSQAVGDTAGIYAYIHSDGGPVANSDEGVTGISVAADESDQGYYHGTVVDTVTADQWTPKVQQASKATVLTTESVAIANNVLTLTFASDVTLPVTGTTLTLNDPAGLSVPSFLNGTILTVDAVSGSSILATYSYNHTDSTGTHNDTYPTTRYKGTATTIVGAPWTTDGGILLNMSQPFFQGNVTGGEDHFGAPGARAFLMQMPVISTGTAFPDTTAWGAVISTQVPDGFAITNPAVSMDTNKPVELTVKLQLQNADGSYKKFTTDHVVSVAGSNYPEQCKVSKVEDLDPQVDPAGQMQKITVGVRYPNALAYIFQGGLAGHYLSLDANVPFSGMRSTYYAFAYLDGKLVYGAYVGGGVEGHVLFGTNDMAANSDPNLSPLRSGFHLYRGAEIVANMSLGADLVLEPNEVGWTAGDVVEGPHPCNFGGATLFARRLQFSPVSRDFFSASALIGCSGPGIGQNYLPLSINNESNPLQYGGNYDQLNRTGPLTPPVMMTLNGANGGSIFSAYAPLYGNKNIGSVIRVYLPNRDKYYAPNTTETVRFQPFGVLCMPRGESGQVASIVFDPNNGQYTAYAPFAAEHLIAIRQCTPTSSTPATCENSSTPFTCSRGEMWSDNDFLYVGMDNNQVKRVALSSFTAS